MDAEPSACSLSPSEFCSRAIPALCARESENGLPIGLALRLTSTPPSAGALLLAVESEGAVVGASVWTPPHEVVVTRLSEDGLACVADRCSSTGWPITGATGPEDCGSRLAERLARRTGAEVRIRMRQRVYELRAVNPVPRAVGAMRMANARDLRRVVDWYDAFVIEVGLPRPTNPLDWARTVITSGSAFVWDVGDEVRSLACLSRHTPNGRTIGPVYTPPDARRRGYATSLVAELAGAVLASGKRFACLFTDASNPTSNRMYESIGFGFVCNYDAYSLVPHG